MDTDSPYSIGIALSGGGTRGLAHIGVLEVLAGAGIVPDVISGASAGSLVGALQQADFTPDQMVNFFHNVPLFRTKGFTWAKPGLIDPMSLHDEIAAFFPENTFEGLQRPLFVNTTNLETGELEVFSSGPLVQPLLASSAVPGMFAPVQIKEHLYGDGGIYSNLPAKTIRSQCDFLIGVYVHPYPIERITAKDLKSALRVISRAYEIGRSVALQGELDVCDYVIITHEIEEYGIFDIEHMDEIYEVGKRTAQERVGELADKLAHHQA